jgi:hypothetical protein
MADEKDKQLEPVPEADPRDAELKAVRVQLAGERELRADLCKAQMDRVLETYRCELAVTPDGKLHVTAR